MPIRNLGDKNFIIGMLLFLLAAYFPVFHHLGSQPILVWDESLFAIRALFMADTGEYLQNFNYYPGLADHLNTKPPLITIIQAVFFKLFGYSELSLRLPIALSFLALLLFIIRFFKKYFKIPVAGFMVAMVLICCKGLVTWHMTRSGDHDVPLAVFMFLSFSFFYLFFDTEDKSKQKKFWWLAILFLTAAFLTKNVLALMFLPGVLLYALYQKKFLWLLQWKSTYFGIGAFVLINTLVFVGFELKYPGFLERMWNYELLGRYTQTFETHKHSFTYFIDRWWNGTLLPWLYYLPFSIAIIFTPAYKQFKNILVFALFAAIPYLLVISNSDTKLFWYDAPLLPLITLVVGIGIYCMYDFLEKSVWEKSPFRKNVFVIYFVGIVFMPFYRQVFNSVNFPKNNNHDDEFGYMFRHMEKKSPNIREFTVALGNFGTHPVFYQQIYKKKGYDVKVTRNFDALENGELLMVCQNKVMDVVTKNYNYTQEMGCDCFCKMIRIHGRK